MRQIISVAGQFDVVRHCSPLRSILLFGVVVVAVGGGG